MRGEASESMSDGDATKRQTSAALLLAEFKARSVELSARAETGQTNSASPGGGRRSIQGGLGVSSPAKNKSVGGLVKAVGGGAVEGLTAAASARLAKAAAAAAARAARQAVVAGRAASAARAAPRSVTGVADDVGMACRTNSFVPATLVLMADGTTKPIADVQIGDMVMATDPETGERGPRRVTDTIVGDGVKELEGRWVDAEDLERGDVLLLVDSQTVAVEGVTERTEVRRVHNLTVDGIHTYFVLAGDDPVLVHNCTGAPRPPRRPQKPSDPPSWVRQGGHYAEATDASPAAAARRILDEQYGPGGWTGTGAGSEFSQTQKWLSRYFEWG